MRRPTVSTGEDQRVRTLVEPVLAGLGLHLLDCSWQGGRRRVLRLTVDRTGGVGVDDCGVASLAVSEVLDAHEAEMPSRYELEVSSPGAERTLLGDEDYQASLGRRVQLRLVREAEERMVEGRLVSVGRGALELEVRRRSGRTIVVQVDRKEVASARVVVDI